MPRFPFALLLIAVFFAACSQNNVTTDKSLGKYFDSAGVKGCFGLFDNGQGQFTIFDLARYRDSAYQPAATFDIFQSLVGLQTGIVKDDSAELATNLPLFQAFRSDSDSGFTHLAAAISRDTLKKWVDSLHYGNRKTNGDVFWSDNHLKVTADEQLGLAKKLYFSQLPFFQRTQKLVVDMMATEGNSNYMLYYKTGQGVKEDGHAIGWVLGWIEENKHPYFFVINLESADPSANLSRKGLAIAHSILAKLEFFSGKR